MLEELEELPCVFAYSILIFRGMLVLLVTDEIDEIYLVDITVVILMYINFGGSENGKTEMIGGLGDEGM